MADFHNHQFAHLGFAQSLHTHGTDPAEGCRRPLAFNENSLRVTDMVRQGVLAEARRQFERGGGCFPTAYNLAGQQVSEDSLFRAYRYGLRLMVMFALNSEFLCRQMVSPTADCGDLNAIERQIDAAYALEAKLDAAAGGDGMGWYQIVRSPEEARQVINSGKLAVVLGIEASGAFDCGLRVRIPVREVPPVVILAGTEPKYELSYDSGGCPEFGVPGLSTSIALARMDHYWERGVRHFFPIHTFNNQVGGTALSTPLLHSNQNPAGIGAGNTIFNRAPAINNMVATIRPPFKSSNCGFVEFDGGRCNADGLSETGKHLVTHMAAYGAVIDVDHMSALAKLQTMTLFGDMYPLASSHTGVLEINNKQKSNEVQVRNSEVERMALADGAFAPILRPANHLDQMDNYPESSNQPGHTCAGTSETFISTYRYMSDQLGRSHSKVSELFDSEPQKFVGLGFGSDFNGLAGWPVPRFWGKQVVGESGPAIKLGVIGPMEEQPHPCIGGRDDGVQRNEGRVGYPIVSPLTGEAFNEPSELTWSGLGQPYDISTSGFAHIGMLPEFVSEMQLLGVSEPELEPMWHGAEAYLRMWTFAAGWGPQAFNVDGNKGIRQDCVDARRELLSFDPSNAGGAITVGIPTMQKLRSIGCAGT